MSAPTDVTSEREANGRSGLRVGVQKLGTALANSIRILADKHIAIDRKSVV